MLFGVKTTSGSAPVAQALATQEMEILGCVGRLRHLDVVLGGESDEALDAGAEVLWFPGPRIREGGASRRRKQVRLGFTGADELVNHGLGDVDESPNWASAEGRVTRTVATVSVFEARTRPRRAGVKFWHLAWSGVMFKGPCRSPFSISIELQWH